MRYSGLLLWGVYFGFVVVAFAVNWHDQVLDFSGDYAIGKALVWVALIAFIAYSRYCSSVENFFKAVSKINKFHWGRQIGIDLYIGVFVFLAVIYLHSGSAWVMLAWSPFILFFANMATLVYLAIFYDDIVRAIADSGGVPALLF